MSRVPDRSQAKEEVAETESLSNTGRHEENDPGQETAEGQEGFTKNPINLPLTNTSGVTEPAEEDGTNQGTHERPRREMQDEFDSDPGTAEGSESKGLIQDQVILAPEIMENILEHLDLKALKQGRLVCKSWLLEAQSHMERRAIVWLGGDQPSSSSTRIQEFMKLRTSPNRIQALPQPFMSLDVDLKCRSQGHTTAPHEWALAHLSALVSPPLVITRFVTDCFPVTFALPLIVQCSSRLEYLKLFGRGGGYGDEKVTRSMKKYLQMSVNFPKLRHVCVETLKVVCWDGFHQLLRWILRASPHVDTFEARTVVGTSKEETNRLLRVVDLGRMRTLRLGELTMDQSILSHFSSIQFPQLQHLRMHCIFGDARRQVLLTIVTKAALTLTKLELDSSCRAGSEFPVCPNVQELQLWIFPGWNDFVSRCFPSLKHFVLGVSYEDQGLIPASPPLVEVRTLSLPLQHVYRPGSFGPMELFSTFPALESLHIEQSFLIEYHRMKTSGEPGFSDLLRGLKHLTLLIYFECEDTPDVADYSFFDELKGLETLTVGAKITEISQVLKIPFPELPNLRELRFPWGSSSSDAEVKNLVEIVRGVKKVRIANCCSFLRGSLSESKDFLKMIFDSAPNAVCGCKN